MDINLRTLSHQAACKILENSTIGKALNTQTPSPQQNEDLRRKESMIKSMAQIIEETFRPWSNEQIH